MFFWKRSIQIVYHKAEGFIILKTDFLLITLADAAAIQKRQAVDDDLP